MPNRLADETSPYLLQHQNNPVDWYPWGEAAFARAAAENRPIFLSIGYSSCHWCHVMAHESFEDEEVAKALNDHFVCVKVDREERPDVDDAFMTAVQLTSGHGGWPMSVFLTPEKKPFFGGTYFPKNDRSGHPGFLSLCGQISTAWLTRPQELLAAAEEVTKALTDSMTKKAPVPTNAFDRSLFDTTVKSLAADFDRNDGGFGGAPKFPPHSAIEFLMQYAMIPDAPDELREIALGMAISTLTRMAMGGIHDHVGGGFHRYSTDQHWLLPHFEKMLYDNALMLANFSRGAALASEIQPELGSLLQGAASGIVEWIASEMVAPEGYFYAALDADSEGEEGRYYVWSESEIRGLLGPKADRFLLAYSVRPEGNFTDEASGKQSGQNILHLTTPAGPPLDEELDTLAKARKNRVRPGLDDKALVGWNGLAIEALALAGLVGPATLSATAILIAEKTHGGLPRHIAQGRPFGVAFLEDYAYFANGLFKLASLTGFLVEQGAEMGPLPKAEVWLYHAERLTQEMVKRFYDEEGGGFFATSDDHEELFGKSKPIFDQPIPSANAIAIRCLLEVGDLNRARQSVNGFLGWVERAPQATEALLTTAMALLEATAITPVATEPVPSTKKVEPMPEVSVRLVEKEIQVGPDGRGVGCVRLTIPQGVHLNSSQPAARWLTPTRLDIRPLNSEVQYPPAIDESYEGDLEISFSVDLPPGEAGAEFEIEVSYQPCTDTECLSPAKKTLNAVAVR